MFSPPLFFPFCSPLPIINDESLINLLIPYVKIGTVIRSYINTMLTFGNRGSSGILA